MSGKYEGGFMEKIDIGNKIRSVRKLRGLSLRDLGKLSHCSVTYLSQLERGLNSPTIETLIKITEALKIQLVDFFSENNLNDSPKVIRKKNRKTLSGELSGVTYEMLSSGEDLNLDAFQVTLKPKTKIGKVAHEQKGTEFLYVLYGQLDLIFNGMDYKLFSGDSICFEPSKQHELKNTGSSKVEIISISTPPR